MDRQTEVFPGGVSVKEPSWQCRCNIRDAGSIPGPRRSPGERHGSPLQYSCLETLMNRRAWWATIHRFAKSWAWPKRLSMYACMIWYQAKSNPFSNFILVQCRNPDFKQLSIECILPPLAWACSPRSLQCKKRVHWLPFLLLNLPCPLLPTLQDRTQARWY